MSDLIEQPHKLFWKQLCKWDNSDYQELINTEKQNRNTRIENAFKTGTEVETTGIDQQLFDRMWIGENLQEVNKELLQDFNIDLNTTKARKKDSTVSPAYDLYHLMRNSRLISFYYCFGKKSKYFPGRLNVENEDLLLELLWWRTMDKNDIAITTKSTWWMSGSENHDLNSKQLIYLLQQYSPLNLLMPRKFMQIMVTVVLPVI
ncbi:MAG: hypothetical protein OCD02_06585 [Spirochaetaceae bacterium]